MAAIYIGACGTPAIALGTFLGGYLTKKFKLNASGSIMLYIVCQMIALPLTLAFLLTCPNIDFCGVNVECGSPGLTTSNYSYSCNMECSCSEYNYHPVCGSDNQQYYNPCFAGCLENLHSDEYSQCLCIDNGLGTASTEMCDSNCDRSIAPVIAVLFLYILFTFTAYVPNYIAVLRTVPPVHKSLGIGLESIIRRYLCKHILQMTLL